MLKVNYSCMGNVAFVLSAHNRNILYPKKHEFGCDWRSMADCLLANKCLTPKIVYQADVLNDTNDENKSLIRSVRISLNCRNIYGKLEDANVTPIITWKVVA